MQQRCKLYLSSAMVALCLTASFPHAEEATESASTKAQATSPEITAEQGKQLFNSFCKHCHNITYDESTTGAPGLRGVLERHDEAWINQWLKNPESFAKTNETARDLIDSNRFGLIMPTLPSMQNENNRLAIIEYLKTLK